MEEELLSRREFCRGLALAGVGLALAPGEVGKVFLQALETHIVRPGDTLSKIAGKYGVDWRALAEYNKLSDPSLIHPGQKIEIPDGSPPPTAAIPSSTDLLPKPELGVTEEEKEIPRLAEVIRHGNRRIARRSLLLLMTPGMLIQFMKY